MGFLVVSALLVLPILFPVAGMNLISGLHGRRWGALYLVSTLGLIALDAWWGVHRFWSTLAGGDLFLALASPLATYAESVPIALLNLLLWLVALRVGRRRGRERQRPGPRRSPSPPGAGDPAP